MRKEFEKTITYKTNSDKKGYGVPKLPLYFNNKFTGEYVIYVGDLSYEHYEIVTNKTFYYDIDLRKAYVIIEYDSKIIINIITPLTCPLIYSINILNI